MQAASAPGAQTQAPPDTSGDSTASTSTLVVELAQLRYTLRTWIARDAGRSVGAFDGEVRSLLRRRDAVLTELHRRGLDFGDAHAERTRTRKQVRATPVEPSPDLEHTALVDLTAKVEQLERGLSSRTVIGQAQGILIERHTVSADAAFRMLVQASQTSNRKLRDVAACLVLLRCRPNRVPAERRVER
jgi:hypothetical protein